MARFDRFPSPGWFRGPGLAALVALTAAACGPAPQAPLAAAPASGWMDFEGSFNATGTRRTLSLGERGRSAILDLKGSMLLAGPGRPGTGFQGEVIALLDPKAGLVGRSVWTDERGDEVYSELEGEGTATRNRITGTILGGTGRYAGATGSYEFSWQWVMEAEDGSIQGRAVELTGRVRPGTAAGSSPR